MTPIPISRQARPARPSLPENHRSPGDILKGKRVCIVEDEGLTQMLLQNALRRSGMEVAGVAGNGNDGVSVVVRARPDMVLMDVNMPGNINGLEATKRILAAIRTCVIIVSAYDEYAQSFARYGACGFISKPVDSRGLVVQLAAIYEKFAESSGTPPAPKDFSFSD